MMRLSLGLLADRGEQVVLVAPGAEFERVDTHAFRPRSRWSLGLPKARRDTPGGRAHARADRVPVEPRERWTYKLL